MTSVVSLIGNTTQQQHDRGFSYLHPKLTALLCREPFKLIKVDDVVKLGGGCHS